MKKSIIFSLFLLFSFCSDSSLASKEERNWCVGQINYVTRYFSKANYQNSLEPTYTAGSQIGDNVIARLYNHQSSVDIYNSEYPSDPLETNVLTMDYFYETLEHYDLGNTYLSDGTKYILMWKSYELALLEDVEDALRFCKIYYDTYK